MKQVFLILFFLSPVFCQTAKSPPQFENFPAAKGVTGRHATPKLRSAYHKAYRTRIREGAKLPANFAGRYRIVEWGCGSPCSAFVVVDLKTGEVYNLPFQSFTAMNIDCRAEGATCDDGEGLIFKPNSRLLIADGYGSPTGEFGRFYYAWKNHRFKLIRADIKKQDAE